MLEGYRLGTWLICWPPLADPALKDVEQIRCLDIILNFMQAPRQGFFTVKGD